MQEPLNSEVVKLLFTRIDEKLADFKEAITDLKSLIIKNQSSTNDQIQNLEQKIEATNQHFDDRVTKLETIVIQRKAAIGGVVAAWGAIVAVAGAVGALISFAYNKII